MADVPTHLNRRAFLKSSGGVALFIGVSGILPQFISCRDTEKIREKLEQYPVTAWVKLSEDGQMTIYNPAAEMGQGSMTSLPALFAEEMDADWSRVSVAFSPQEAEIYGGEGWVPGTKLMFTVGSRTTHSYYWVIRKAGAQARHVLMYSAARHWGVPLEEISTSGGTLIHEPTGKRMDYGEVVPYLVMPEPLPEIAESALKSPEEFRIVGTDLARVDIPPKVDGSALFAVDLRLPDMVYGLLERGNLHGARPKLLNEAEILDMPGILKVVPFDYAIGLVAETLEAGLAAKKRLRIAWSASDASGHDSEAIYERYTALAAARNPGEVLTDQGDTPRALQAASKRYSADFKNDYVYHAQMEPLNAVVQVAADHSAAEVWVGSQQGPDTKLGVPSLLGIPHEKVTVHLQYLGGGFGRRSMNDFVEECATLARAMAPRPVKLLWTREDDMAYGAFRPLSLQRIEVGTDAGGTITAFSHTVVGDGGNLVASGTANDHYDIPNHRVEWREARNGIRLKHWRAVGHGPNKFAIECMLDEIVRDQGMDPVAFRRRLMHKSPRALATLDKAAEMADWNSPPPEGRARGVAFVEHGSLGTGICEISLDRDSGTIRVHRFWIALDAGVPVHPDNIKAQMEGGIIMGMSSVLKERITITDGRVNESNFDGYSLLRMQEVPDAIAVSILPSAERPEGVGETATPMVACAIANAFFALTGKRLRHMPFTPGRVREALNGQIPA